MHQSQLQVHNTRWFFMLLNNNLENYSKSILLTFFISFHILLKVLIYQPHRSSSIHFVQLLYSTITIFSKCSPQTSQIQFLEETSTGVCVGAIPQGPPTLHRDKMTPLLHCALSTMCTAHCSSVLYCTTLYYKI